MISLCQGQGGYHGRHLDDGGVADWHYLTHGVIGVFKGNGGGNFGGEMSSSGASDEFAASAVSAAASSAVTSMTI
jgi:hypothetical protein